MAEGEYQAATMAGSLGFNFVALQKINDHLHPVARRLFELAEEKQSNLAVSAGLTDTESLLKLAD
ncbi:hypothetical protein B0T14DRAFT_605556 [Immersiella caudata]|uniref:Uncharacterized protein n=1 Tax=Immersiella caudata TaxID=314043 RepID=A0AA39WLB6_9PEZI|nr:hypothetical protein B0T14DRAFT_605556 [Immersiella caudata]